jgi:DNA-binding response OmpR family regulator
MPTVLLVEDDESLRDLLHEWLTFEGYTVASCGTGQEAFEQLRTVAFDIIILDWNLAGINGIDILIKYRAAGGESPVLMLTGSTSKAQKQEALAAGATSFMRKPCDLVELVATLAQLVAGEGKESV